MIRMFALVSGILFFAVGVLGLVPGLRPYPPDAPPLEVELGHGYLLGLFPVNIVNSLVLIGLGIWGILTSRRQIGAVGYARALSLVFFLLAILGLIPATNTLFGVAPLHGNDVWLHAVAALVAFYFGFLAPVSTETVEEVAASQGKNREAH